MNMNLTEIIFLLDRSGSMGGLENDTIGGFNAFLHNQKQLDGKTLITTVLFDNQYELLWNGIDANNVKLTSREYFVRGTTALLDAVGKTILDVGYRLANTKEEDRPGKVIFVIITDGMENSSKEFTYSKIKELIQHQQQKYNWEFVFLGANIDAVSEAENIGICEDNAYNFEATGEGVKEMYCMVCEEVSHRRYRKS
ncbi:MAG TPA: vWA domain-containing protein [Patescibacteria group bacterium]|nr:vWA domain-containing protein [Patescibacteria group bacterium]